MSRNLDDTHPEPVNLNIYLNERDSSSTRLISVGSSGIVDAGTSVDPAISGSGRYVAFSSTSSSLVDGLSAMGKQIYLFDADTSKITLVSRGIDGRVGNADSGYPSISADGRMVTFSSEASNLVANDSNSASDVFVFDLMSGRVQRVSVGPAGEEADGASDQASISADGRRVAYRSAAANLVAGDTNGVEDVFLYDMASATTSIVSVAGGTDGQGNAASSEPSLSRDGNLIAFTSAASNFSPHDGNGVTDIFLRDVISNKTSLISRTKSGSAGDGFSVQPRISADGSHIVFLSAASSLIPADKNGRRDIFLVTVKNGKTQRVNTGPRGKESNGNSYQPAISCDGSIVAFRSGASNLIETDTNHTDDVFVVDVVSH